MILNDNSTQQINTLVIQLQNRITNLTNEFNKKVSKINDEISNLDTLKKEIADLVKDQINVDSSMNKQITENKNNIAANTSAISALNTQIQTNRDNIATNTSDISALKTSVAGKADKNHTHTKSQITDFPTSLKNPNALTVNGKTYDGSTAVDAGIQTVANGGTGATTAKGAFMNLANGLSEDVNPIDTEHIIFKNTDGTNWGLYKLSHFWEYIKGKISSVLGLTKDNYGGKSAKSSFLDEYVGAGGTRPTSINFVPKNSSEYGGMRKDVVTSSMTDGSYPGQDGHLLTMFWDNTGRYDNQLFVSNERQPLEVKVRAKANEADYGPWVDLITSQNIGSQTVAKAKRLETFASWNNPYEWDPTNGVRVNVYKITMPSVFNSILVQIFDDINYARCRRYVLGLWHKDGYGYSVSVTDLGGTKDGGLRVWMGTDGNVYLQADVCWISRISFSYLDDLYDFNVSVTKIGDARYGSNADINGNVLFTPLADPIVDCGALRADENLSSAQKIPQILKTDVLKASNITSLEQRVAALESRI